MTIEAVLKRAGQHTRPGKRKWERYEAFKQDIRRLAKSPNEYEAAIRRLQQVMRI